MAGEEVGPGFTAEPIVTAAEKAAEERRVDLVRSAPLVGDMLGDAFALMKARATGQAKPIPLPWPNVSERLGGGLWPGLHVLTGATGQGKTQFALQVAWRAAGAGVPVLYVGLELDRLGVVCRLLALAEGEATGRTPKWSDLYLGKSAGLVERLERQHAQTLRERPFRAEFGPPHGWDFRTLSARVRALREESPETGGPGSRPLLVVLDFLQVVGPPEGERMELRERIGRASYAARQVAREHGAAVLLLSSTSRENAKTLSGKGKDAQEVDFSDDAAASDFVGMGKESGDIEYSADSVMSLLPGQHDGQSRAMNLAVAKVRAGAPGWCPLEFNGAMFSEQDAGWEQTSV